MEKFTGARILGLILWESNSIEIIQAPEVGLYGCHRFGAGFISSKVLLQKYQPMAWRLLLKIVPVSSSVLSK
ncbi:MAG: hypothetical protein A2X81_12130 [Desulfobacterales bacterium GWB2_56_26]|nr:MAG: hypothetical protein A2X81_12130 [Desulfobacterales bacterium GWB2_56_26]